MKTCVLALPASVKSSGDFSWPEKMERLKKDGEEHQPTVGASVAAMVPRGHKTRVAGGY